ncbi:MAG: acetyl-CoA carboxylase biotin carboxylase subunit [Candidatus Heimdallarchaeota archaeon]|nr:acetyl-CoA carboxylase biotin carboxylase subunit [Candidatus Heimdallarchaeota archaeon]
MIEKLLIANRAEIAVRIHRAAKMLEMDTVAIYSEQDKYSMHTRIADEAVSMGYGPAIDNYLNIEKIIDIATTVGADGIHPGYGFLSESAEFAQKVIENGLIWVGPPPMAISQLGNKLKSREVAQKVGVPTTPGTDEPVNANKEALVLAREIGYPIMVKAAFGGGGMGMAVVRSEDELVKAIERTSKQAHSAFGKSQIFLEKYVEKPKHIEFQFIADSSGHVVHLGERECSIQRRHQKLLEEAPSPAMTPELREEVGEKVKKLAKSVGYINAGTAEFLMKDGELYFNEVNARLQVEHPVTEMITGKDLVLEQLRVATGKSLSWKQEDISFRGHAIELRINAEDPVNDFRPSPGKILNFVPPGGFGIRFDSHIYDQYQVPSDYDSMLGKLIVWGENRKQAIHRAYYALNELTIVGFPTNAAFHRVLLANKEFHQGKITTNFIDDSNIISYIKEAFNRRVAALFMTGLKTSKVILPDRSDSKWKDQGRYESTGRIV